MLQASLSNPVSCVQVCADSREDLLSDYFSRSPAPLSSAGTPTSYVTPTVHSSNPRPGHSVRPSPRQPVGQSPAPGSQRGSQSLSRAFSLASADLLHSHGPGDSFRGGDGQSEAVVVVRRSGGGANGRERPLSARLAGPANQSEEGGFLNPPVHHSSSLTLHAERDRERGRAASAWKSPSPSSSAYHHHGEVAMVTPVRAMPATLPGDAPNGGEGPREAWSADLKKEGERARCSSVERPKSTPASPDPNNDPQTVWYEYGCV